ncbi:pullulanase, partial [Klebsiella pneumoniae]
LQEGRLTAPASLLSRWLMSTMPVKAAGEVTFSLTEGRFSDGRCRHIIAGGAQWRQARLHSPVGSLELAQVNGTFRCTEDGAVALTLRQDSHQLSLSGQGTLSPDGRYLFRGTLQPRQGMPPLLALLVTRPTANNAPGPTPWQLQGKWLPQEQK